MPAANEDRLALTLETFALLLPTTEIALEVITVPNCYLTLAVGALFYERALVLDLSFFYYALAFPKALFELALIGDSSSPGIYSYPCWLT